MQPHDDSDPLEATSGRRQLPAKARVALRLSEVHSQPARWLWPGRLPLGKVVLLDGDPGLGKSTLTLDLAARVSRGFPMPGQEEPTARRGVLLLSAEDDLADTIRPRLEAAGADLDHVHAFGPGTDGQDGLPVLPADLPALVEVALEHDVALIVIDPLLGFLTADAYRDQLMRRVMAQLAAAVAMTEAVVICVRHLTKAPRGSALYRGSGSIGIVAAARVALVVAPDPGDESRRVLAVAKSNLGVVPPPLAYRLVPHGQHDVAVVQWEGEVEWSAADLLSPPPAPAPRLAQAEQLLREMLADGPVLRREIEAAAGKRCIGWRTVETAKASLAIEDSQVPVPGQRGPGPSCWRLPVSHNDGETHRVAQAASEWSAT